MNNVIFKLIQLICNMQGTYIESLLLLTNMERKF